MLSTKERIPVHESRSRRWMPWLAMAALSLLLVAVYAPGLGGAWVFDDFPNIVDNAALRVSWESGWERWRDAALSSASRDLPRPLAMLSFAIDHAVHGLDVRVMKATNIAIHLLNSWLVFGLVRALLQAPAVARATSAHRDLLAAWCAAAWALNAIHVTAVLFVVQRMEVLSHSFVLAGLWIFVLGRLRLERDGKGWLMMVSGVVLGAGLGVLVKESAVLLPLYAALVEWVLMRDAPHRTAAKRRGLLAFFAATLMLPGVVGLSVILPRALAPGAFDGRAFTLAERLLTEARVLLDYLHWSLVPDLGRMSLYHDAYPISHGPWTPPSTTLAILALGLLAALALRVRKTHPVVSIGIAWFIAAHLLTATVWPLELVFEHRNYFASLGVCLAVAGLLLSVVRAARFRAGGMVIALAFLALHAGATGIRAREWSDQLGFSKIEAEKQPDSPRASFDYARNLVILADFRSDSPYFEPARLALERAMRVPGASPLTESAAIQFAAQSGIPVDDAWWEQLATKLRTRKTGLAEINALANLSDCVTQGHCRLPHERIVEVYLAAIEQGPHPRVLHDYGRFALTGLREPDLALALFEDAVQGEPTEVVYRISLARLLLASGERERALEQIDAIRHYSRLGQHADLIRALSDEARVDHASDRANAPR